MSISTEYRGMPIYYNGNTDRWVCADIDAKDALLSKIKRKIDAHFAKMRKASAFKCYELGRTTPSGRKDPPLEVKVYDATIIEYIGEVWEGGGWTKKPSRISNHKVASVAQREHRERPTRGNMHLSDMVPATNEARAAIYAAEEKLRAANVALQEYENALKAIPRVTIEDISEIVAVSKAQQAQDEGA